MSGKKPDYVILHVGANTLRCTVAEMKSVAHHPRSIIEQLQAGADAIQHDSRFSPLQQSSYLLPLVVHGRGMKADDALYLQSKAWINFRGRRFFIALKRSGVNLSGLAP